MSLLFISHSSRNNAEALAIAKWLEDNGWPEYFLDISEGQGLEPGVLWRQALSTASHRCEAVIILVSEHWLNSTWCMNELLLSKQLGKKVFGVLIEDIAFENLSSELTGDTQLCDLVAGDDRVKLDVERDPIVAATEVDFSAAGLAALKRGLEKAGLAANAFPWPPQHDPERVPYRGLKRYEPQDAAIYFGRDAAIVHGLDQIRKIRDQKTDRMLVILGASGSGKSSFMRAGLWPRLKRDDSNFYPLPIVRPGRAAIDGEEGLVNALFSTLAEAGVKDLPRGKLRERFAQDPEHTALRDTLADLREAVLRRSITANSAPTFILPIDQGEELYTSEDGAQAAQLRQLLGTLQTPASDGDGAWLDVVVLTTIRTDHYEYMQADEILKPISRQLIDLTPMDRAEYKTIIEGPAQRATDAGNRLVIAPELSAQLLLDTRGADALPMLAFTLERLFADYADDGKLTLDEYETMGGVAGSLTAAIRAALSSPDDAPAIPHDTQTQHELLKSAFIPWLAEIDEQSGERRRRVAAISEIPEAAIPIITRLEKARLIIRDVRGDSGSNRGVIEIAHEALLRRWPALVDWLDADEDALKAIGSVSRAADTWQHQARDAEYLIHSGERLHYAENLLLRNDFAHRLNEPGTSYLLACRARDDRIARQKQQQRSFALAGLAIIVVLAVVAVLFGVDAGKKSTIAENNWRRAEANESRALATMSNVAMNAARFDDATKLALASWPRNEKDTRPQLRAGVQSLNKIKARFPYAVPAMTHKGPVLGASFNADETRVLSWSWDKTARIWDTSSGRQIGQAMRHEHNVSSAVFSADQARVLTASWDHSARLWDATSGLTIGQPMLHSNFVMDARFSPDQSLILSWSMDRTARLWDAATGKPVGQPMTHRHNIEGAIFSATGDRVLTWSSDNFARLWDGHNGNPIGEPMPHMSHSWSPLFRADGTQLLTATGRASVGAWNAENATGHLPAPVHKDSIDGAIYSPDGARILTWSADQTIRVWDSTTGQASGTVMQHPSGVAGIRLSQDGHRILSWCEDGSAHLWDADGKPVGAAMMHPASIFGVTFNAQEDRILTWAQDKTARVWDAATGKPIGNPMQHPDYVWEGSFSASGNRVLTHSEDHAVRLWDAATGIQLGYPMRHEDSIKGATLSLRGDRVLTWSEDRHLVIWDAAQGKPQGQLIRHDDLIAGAAFDRRAERVLSWSWDNSVKISRSIDGRPIGRPMRHDDTVRGAVFDQDESHVLSWSKDRSVRVWDAQTGLATTPSMWHDGGVWGASFSRDGTRILSWSEDRTARLWDADTGQAIGPPMTHQGQVIGALFSPDETLILSWAEDHTVRLWDSGSTHAIGQAMRHHGRINGAVFNPNQQQILSWSEDKTARVWNTADGQPASPPLLHEDWVKGAQFSHDASRILTWSGDQSVRMWDALSGAPAGAVMVHEDAVLGAAFSPEDTLVLSWSSDGTAQLWHATTGRPAGPALMHDGPVSGAQFSPDGHTVVSWSEDGTVKIWDVATRRSKASVVRHHDAVKGVSFSHDGVLALSWSADGIVQIWLTQNGEPLSPVLAHNSQVMRAEFSADKRYVLSWSTDNAVQIWSISDLAPATSVLEWACNTTSGHDLSLLQSRYGITVSEPICAGDMPRPEWIDLED